VRERKKDHSVLVQPEMRDVINSKSDSINRLSQL